MSIPSDVKQWERPVMRWIDRYDLVGTLYPYICLVQLWQESGGDASVGEDYKGSGHFGLLQIGRSMTQWLQKRVDWVPDGVSSSWWDGRGERSIRAYCYVQKFYRERTGFEPMHCWTLWGAGPTGLARYLEALERRNLEHPSRTAYEEAVDPILPGIVDYLERGVDRAGSIIGWRWEGSA